MNKIKFNELKNLSQPELTQKKNSLEKELFELRQKRASGQLDKPHFFKAIRRQIAQINTLQKETKHA